MHDKGGCVIPRKYSCLRSSDELLAPRTTAREGRAIPRIAALPPAPAPYELKDEGSHRLL